MSRAAKMVRSSIITNENAPWSLGSTRIAASSSPSPLSRASIEVTRSESVVARLFHPASSASAAVFTRFPLWPSAMDRAPSVLNDGCALSQVVEPVVEYRLWPIPRSPWSVDSVLSPNTCDTKPRSL